MCESSNLPPFSLPSLPPIDVGVIVGVGASGGTGPGATVGFEIVFDLYDFEVDSFVYGGAAATWGAGATVYVGGLTGWAYFPADQGVLNYRGPFASIGVAGEISLQVFTGPAGDGGRMIGALLGAGPSAEMSFKGQPFRIPGNPSFGAPVYKTFGEVAAWFGLGNGQSRRTFHRNGPREKITQQDAHDFLAFLAPLAVVSPPLMINVAAIIEYNGYAWSHQQ